MNLPIRRFAGSSILLLFALICGCSSNPGSSTDPAPAPPALPQVQVIRAQYGILNQYLSATGTLSELPYNESTIDPSVSGVLDSFPLQFGQYVVKGQVIAHLSTQTVTGQIQQAEATLTQNALQVQQAQVSAEQQHMQAEASIEQASAAVSNAQATLASDQAVLTGNQAAEDNARQNLDRENSLYANGLVAQKDIEADQLAVNTAAAQVEAQKQTIEAQRQTVAGLKHELLAAETGRMQDAIKNGDIQIARQQVLDARAALHTARAQLNLYTLRAPFAGRITFVGANLGEAVNPTTKLVTITNIDTMQLEVSVPAESSSLVHVGQPVAFRVDSYPSLVFHTLVQSVASQVDTTNGTVTVQALVSNAGHRLKDDELAKATITTDRRSKTLIVPKSAVLIDPGSGAKTVAVVGSDDVLHVRPVSTGLISGDLEEITNGLQAGDDVAVVGQYAIPDGTKVSVQRGA